MNALNRGFNIARGDSVYASTAKFDGSARALTEDEMRKIAPSIFAVTAHESRSARFMPIPTIEVLRGLMQEGFMPVGVKQGNTRDPGKADFTKHLIRLRRLDDDVKHKVGDTVCEVLLKNANDGTAAYDIMAGMFRIRCSNSLVAHTSTLESARVRHSGDVQTKVIDATYKVLNEAHNLLAAPQDWSQLAMSRDESLVLAEAAHVLRFADSDGEVHTPFQPQQLLTPRRHGDQNADLWTTFNVVQENVIRGVPQSEQRRTWHRSEDGRRMRRASMREIGNIDGSVKLNKALFVLTARMAELKGCHSIKPPAEVEFVN